MKIKLYREFQGTGSEHADEHGFCWCAQAVADDMVIDGSAVVKKGSARYLSANDVDAAMTEACARFGVQKSEIEVA